MNKSIPYHHLVEWSDDDKAFIGFCPDLFIGGAWMKELRTSKKPLPPATVRPKRELVRGC